MSNDLVAHLRKSATEPCDGCCYGESMVKAAAEIDRLRAVLKPFADFADAVAAEHPGWDHDDFRVTDGLTMKPFRDARAAYQQNG